MNITCCLIAMAITALTGLPDGMLQDMAAFDRVYIPALASMARDEPEDARRAFGRVEDAWRDMEKKYGESVEDDRFWRVDFKRVNEQIARAKTLLEADEPLGTVREELAKIGEVFQEIRLRYEVPYYLDGLARFRQSLGQVANLLADRAPETLGEDDVQALGFLRESLDYEWKIISESAPDAALFNLNDEKLAEVTALEKAVAFALDHFGAAIRDGDKSHIKQSGLALRAPFDALNNFFGDFGEAVKEKS